MLILQPAEEQRLAVVCLALSLRQREGWRKVWEGTRQPHTGPWSFAARQCVLGRGQWLSALAGTGSPAFPALCHPLCHGCSGSVPPLAARCPYGQPHCAQASSSGLGCKCWRLLCLYLPSLSLWSFVFSLEVSFCAFFPSVPTVLRVVE